MKYDYVWPQTRYAIVEVLRKEFFYQEAELIVGFILPADFVL